MFRDCDLSAKYDLIHAIAQQVTPKRCTSRVTRTSWSTVSKAADMSSSISITLCRRSNAFRISFCTRTSAVSVEWDGVCRQTGFDQGDPWQLRDRVGSVQRVSLATSTQMVSSKLVCSWSGYQGRDSLFQNWGNDGMFHGTWDDTWCDWRVDQVRQEITDEAKRSRPCYFCDIG